MQPNALSVLSSIHPPQSPPPVPHFPRCPFPPTASGIPSHPANAATPPDDWMDPRRPASCSSRPRPGETSELYASTWCPSWTSKALGDIGSESDLGSSPRRKNVGGEARRRWICSWPYRAAPAGTHLKLPPPSSSPTASPTCCRRRPIPVAAREKAVEDFGSELIQQLDLVSSMCRPQPMLASMRKIKVRSYDRDRISWVCCRKLAIISKLQVVKLEAGSPRLHGSIVDDPLLSTLLIAAGCTPLIPSSICEEIKNIQAVCGSS